jgi:hypothetical protein
VKLFMGSGASKARLRLPTVVCVKTPLSTRRAIASLVACWLRPISAAALWTVSIGASRFQGPSGGDAGSSRDVEDLAPETLEASRRPSGGTT